MTYQLLTQPCRNFNVLGIERILDPKDHREKVALSNFASGATGNLILLDPSTGAGESILLPGDSGAWALLNVNDERLLVGTCPEFGYLHALDLARRGPQREWLPSLRDERETYIWNLALGSDVMVYGGTYPGCVLLRYDPARHALDNLGRVSSNTGDLYSRTVYGGLPGHLLIACGYAQPRLWLWEIASGTAGTARPFGKPGATVKEVNARFICTETQGQFDYYDATTFEPLGTDLSAQLAPPPPAPRYSGTGVSVQLGDGRLLRVRGQEYYVEDPGSPGTPANLVPTPTPRPPTRIHSLVSDPWGRLWGSASFGQTIFRYDPVTGDVWNSQVVCNSGGEVYGMTFANGRLFMSAYAGGDHIVYDPAAEWNQVQNGNPRTLQPVGPELIRPAARSVIGPDGHFWTGWWARYGEYGGGLSRVNVDTLEVTRWKDPIPGQGLVGLAADARYLYFVTGGQANGLPEKVESFYFVVWSPSGEPVWKYAFDAGMRLRGVVAAGERVLVSVDSELRVFNPATLAFERTIALDQPCQTQLAWGETVAAFCGNALWRVDPHNGERSHMGDLPGEVSAAAFTPDGTLYFAVGTSLYRWK